MGSGINMHNDWQALVVSDWLRVSAVIETGVISHDPYFSGVCQVVETFNLWNLKEFTCSSFESVIAVVVFNSREVNHTFAGHVTFSQEPVGCAAANSIPAFSGVYQFICTSVLAGLCPVCVTWTEPRINPQHDARLCAHKEVSWRTWPWWPDEKNRSHPEVERETENMKLIIVIFSPPAFSTLYKWEPEIEQLRWIFLPLQRICLCLLSSQRAFIDQSVNEFNITAGARLGASHLYNCIN